jgi:hypothetical protein
VAVSAGLGNPRRACINPRGSPEDWRPTFLAAAVAGLLTSSDRATRMTVGLLFTRVLRRRKTFGQPFRRGRETLTERSQIAPEAAN